MATFGCFRNTSVLPLKKPHKYSKVIHRWNEDSLVFVLLLKKIMSIDLNTNKLLSTDEMAIFFNISKTSVYRLISKRIIPFYKIGGMIRIKKSDILEYLDKNRIKPII
jgi:excisionase family DNA binding protein